MNDKEARAHAAMCAIIEEIERRLAADHRRRKCREADAFQRRRDLARHRQRGAVGRQRDRLDQRRDVAAEPDLRGQRREVDLLQPARERDVQRDAGTEALDADLLHRRLNQRAQRDRRAVGGDGVGSVSPRRRRSGVTGCPK